MKKLKMTQNLIAICAGLISANVCQAVGTMDSGGADLYSPDHGAAWFFRAKEVKYCIRWNAQFGVPEKVVAQEVENAISQWTKYMSDWGLSKLLASSEYAFAKTFRNQGFCNGEEDLRIDAGVSDAMTESARKAMHNPIAYAYRESYDFKKGWGKGFIWLALPKQFVSQEKELSLDWTRPYALSGILLHEFGHVFGNDHIPGTIMQEDIARKILWDTSRSGNRSEERYVKYLQSSLIGINQKRMLYWVFIDRNTVQFEGLVNRHPEREDYSRDAKKTFELMTGRSAVGTIKVRAKYFRDPLSTDPEGIKVVYSDDLGETPLEIRFPGGYTQPQFQSPGKAFRYAIPNVMDQAYSVGRENNGQSEMGVIRLASGRELNVIVAVNGIDGMMIILYRTQSGKLEDLFHAFTAKRVEYSDYK